MRIRKSVPEGYKTTPKPDSTPSQTLPYCPLPLYSKPQELSPYCGLHKIGNLSSQPPAVATHTPPEENLELDLPQLLFNDEDDYDFSPASSQESTPEKGRNLDTSTRLAWPLKKRIWEEEDGEEEEADVGLIALMEQDHEVTSFNTAPSFQTTHHLRTLAQPKTRRKLFGSGTPYPKLQVEGTGKDFDEAAFFNVEDWTDGGGVEGMEM